MVSFYEKDVPYYATTRDGWCCLPGKARTLYESLDEIQGKAIQDLDEPTSPVDKLLPRGHRCFRNGSELTRGNSGLLRSRHARDASRPACGRPGRVSAARWFGRMRPGAQLYRRPRTGELQSLLRARCVVPLYGWFAPETHRPAAPMEEFRGALSYLGTFAEDRQRAVQELFVTTASRMRQERFVLAGAQYPHEFPWQSNMYFVRHLSPTLHPAFFCSSRATLNITRSSMAEYGYCPSGRLFEAAACGAPILSDWWEGLEMFFTPREEILRVESSDDVIQALALSDRELRNIADAARERALEQHTAASRITELESICDAVISGRKQPVFRRQAEVA